MLLATYDYKYIKELISEETIEDNNALNPEEMLKAIQEYLVFADIQMELEICAFELGLYFYQQYNNIEEGAKKQNTAILKQAINYWQYTQEKHEDNLNKQDISASYCLGHAYFAHYKQTDDIDQLKKAQLFLEQAAAQGDEEAKNEVETVTKEMEKQEERIEKFSGLSYSLKELKTILLPNEKDLYQPLHAAYETLRNTAGISSAELLKSKVHSISETTATAEGEATTTEVSELIDETVQEALTEQEQAIEQLKIDKENLNKKLTESENEKTKLNEQQLAVVQEKKELAKKIAALNEQIINLESDEREIKQQYEDEVNQLAQDMSAKDTKINELQTSLKNKDIEMANIRAQLSRKNTEIKTKEQQIKNSQNDLKQQQQQFIEIEKMKVEAAQYRAHNKLQEKQIQAVSKRAENTIREARKIEQAIDDKQELLTITMQKMTGNGLSTLMLGVLKRKPATVKKGLAEGWNPKFKNRKGRSAWHEAVLNFNDDHNDAILKLLLNPGNIDQYDVTILDKNGKLPLELINDELLDLPIVKELAKKTAYYDLGVRTIDEVLKHYGMDNNVENYQLIQVKFQVTIYRFIENEKLSKTQQPILGEVLKELICEHPYAVCLPEKKDQLQTNLGLLNTILDKLPAKWLARSKFECNRICSNIKEALSQKRESFNSAIEKIKLLEDTERPYATFIACAAAMDSIIESQEDLYKRTLEDQQIKILEQIIMKDYANIRTELALDFEHYQTFKQLLTKKFEDDKREIRTRMGVSDATKEEHLANITKLFNARLKILHEGLRNIVSTNPADVISHNIDSTEEGLAAEKESISVAKCQDDLIYYDARAQSVHEPKIVSTIDEMQQLNSIKAKEWNNSEIAIAQADNNAAWFLIYDKRYAHRVRKYIVNIEIGCNVKKIVNIDELAAIGSAINAAQWGNSKIAIAFTANLEKIEPISAEKDSIGLEEIAGKDEIKYAVIYDRRYEKVDKYIIAMQTNHDANEGAISHNIGIELPAESKLPEGYKLIRKQFDRDKSNIDTISKNYPQIVRIDKQLQEAFKLFLFHTNELKNKQINNLARNLQNLKCINRSINDKLDEKKVEKYNSLVNANVLLKQAFLEFLDYTKLSEKQDLLEDYFDKIGINGDNINKAGTKWRMANLLAYIENTEINPEDKLRYRYSFYQIDCIQKKFMPYTIAEQPQLWSSKYIQTLQIDVNTKNETIVRFIYNFIFNHPFLKTNRSVTPQFDNLLQSIAAKLFAIGYAIADLQELIKLLFDAEKTLCTKLRKKFVTNYAPWDSSLKLLQNQPAVEFKDPFLTELNSKLLKQSLAGTFIQAPDIITQAALTLLEHYLRIMKQNCQNEKALEICATIEKTIKQCPANYKNEIIEQLQSRANIMHSRSNVSQDLDTQKFNI